MIEKVPNDVDDTYLAVVGFENEAIAQMLWSWSLHGEPLDDPRHAGRVRQRGLHQRKRDHPRRWDT